MTDGWGIAAFAVAVGSLGVSAFALFRGRHRVSVQLGNIATWTAGVGSVPVARVRITSIGRSMSIEMVWLEWVGPGDAPGGFSYGTVQRPVLPPESAGGLAPFEDLMPSFDNISGGNQLADGEARPYF